MDNLNLNFMLVMLAEKYLEKNEERFNQIEKENFRKGFKEYLDENSETIDDCVYDFLVETGLIKMPRREEVFGSFINKNFSQIKFKRVLDVGAGRLCKLSTFLAKYGFEMHAIDPNIRLSKSEALKKGIKSIRLNKFYCDEFSNGSKGTIVENYDLVIGLEPCDATEHIIRQALKYDKAFAVALCGTPHDSLDGKSFKTYRDWYNYLSSISSDVKIKKAKDCYIATNLEREM